MAVTPEIAMGKAVLSVLRNRKLKDAILSSRTSDQDKFTLIAGVLDNAGLPISGMSGKGRASVVNEFVSLIKSTGGMGREETLKSIDEIAKRPASEVATDALMDGATELTKAGADIARTVGSSKAKAKSILANTTTDEQRSRYGSDLLANALMSLAVKDDMVGNIVGSGLDAVSNTIDKSNARRTRSNELARQYKLAYDSQLTGGQAALVNGSMGRVERASR